MNMQEALDAALAKKFQQSVSSGKYPFSDAEELGNDWYDLRVQPISGESAIRALRARWIQLKRNPRITLLSYLVDGMHVRDAEDEKFDGVRIIQRKIHSFLPPQYSPDAIVQCFRHFSTGAGVFVAGIIDLSNPSLPNAGTNFKTLGMEIRRQATSGDKLRLEHVVPATKLWLDSLR